MLDLYYYQGNLAVELMPDTAVQNLSRFANIYNVPQDQPVAATGNVIVSGTPETPLPTDMTFTLAVPASPTPARRA